jgi:hypothetical protein
LVEWVEWVVVPETHSFRFPAITKQQFGIVSTYSGLLLTGFHQLTTALCRAGDCRAVLMALVRQKRPKTGRIDSKKRK